MTILTLEKPEKSELSQVELIQEGSSQVEWSGVEESDQVLRSPVEWSRVKTKRLESS